MSVAAGLVGPMCLVAAGVAAWLAARGRRVGGVGDHRRVDELVQMSCLRSSALRYSFCPASGPTYLIGEPLIPIAHRLPLRINHIGRYRW